MTTPGIPSSTSPFDALLSAALATPIPQPDHGLFAVLVAQNAGVIAASAPPNPANDATLVALLDLFRT